MDEIPWESYNKIVRGSIDEKTYWKNVNDCLLDLNKYICAITGTNKPYFMIRTVGLDALGIKYIYYIRQCKTAIKDSLGNKAMPKLVMDGKSVKGTGGKWIDRWLEFEKRETYQKEVFTGSEKANPNEFNTFHGFSINRELAMERGINDIQECLNYIRTVICSGETDVYNALLDWCAHLVQNPLQKVPYVPVMRGPEGCGKGSLVTLLSKIIGNHFFVRPSKAEDVIGSFNSIVDRTALVFMDEIVWGGDKQKAGVLKGVLSETEITINEKGIPQRKATSVFNTVIASNEDWVVPAGPTARRFLVLDIDRKSNLKPSCIYECCPYSFARFLYTRKILTDLTKPALATKGLAQQKMFSLDSVTRFIIDGVKENRFLFGQRYPKDAFYADYMEENKKDAHPAERRVFWKRVNAVARVKIIQTRHGREFLMPTKEEFVSGLDKLCGQKMYLDEDEDDFISEKEAEEYLKKHGNCSK
jgi:hypothetical protein